MSISKLTGLLSMGLLSSLAAAQNNPLLSHDEDYVLEVPASDYNGKPALYRNARFVQQDDSGLWELETVEKEVPVLQYLEEAEVIMTDEQPVQVFVRISGTFPNGCYELGRHGVRRSGDVFSIYLYRDYESAHQEDEVCTQALVPFSATVPLPVYGLEAGNYLYIVNDLLTGAFTLSQDNELD